MRKVIFFLILLLVLGVGVIAASFWIQKLVWDDKTAGQKAVILRVSLLADSHNDNELLTKALIDARNRGANFVIGLGDYTDIGTISELRFSKSVFEQSGLRYYTLAGDHDLWDGRNQQITEGTGSSKMALDNFRSIFGEPSFVHEENKIKFIGIDNSDIYRGISDEHWESVKREVDPPQNSSEDQPLARLTFVFAHKTPFHPDSAHIMGEQTPAVAVQAKDFLELMEGKSAFAEASAGNVDGFFSGDLHFFAKFNSPNGSVKMTTIGAVSAERNFQGPRYGLLTIYEDYSWEVEDIEIL